MNMTHGDTNSTGVRRAEALLRVVLGSVALALLVSMAATPAAAQDSALKKAKQEYQFAEYDKAISLFSEVADDPSATKDARRQALRYLGRAYVATGQTSKAREAVKKLLDTQPPKVSFDPDVEPPPIMDIYFSVQKERQGYNVGQDDPGLQTIAVMDFNNNSITDPETYDGLQQGLPSMMINSLNGGTDMKVIERERIDWLLKEIDLQQKDGRVDQSTAVRSGKLLGANAVVFGHFIVHEDRMIIDARVVKVETGEILLGERVTGEPGEFYDLIDELTTQVTRSLNVEMEETKLGSRETKSLDAMMAYSDGLKLLEDGKYRAAYEKFMQATEYDDDFKRAEIKAQSIKPMLMASAEMEGSEAASTQMNR